MGDSKVGIICCGVCCCAGLITLIIILATSFHQLDQLELGLNFNSITLQIEDTVYTEAGINFLGPGHYFIRYPKTVQRVEFVASIGTECPACEGYEILECRTSDGLPVYLSTSFQFQYDESRLRQLYLTYKEEQYKCDDDEFHNCRGVYQDKARAIISNVATNYTSFQFFNDKNGIALAMKQRVTEVFFSELMSSVSTFQITRVELPTQFQNAILASIQAKQNITYSKQFKDNMLVTFDTERLIANQTRLQTIALARGSANQKLQEADAKAELVRQSVRAEMNAYGNFSQIVDLDVTEALDYIWWSKQQETRGKEFLVGVDPQSYIRGSL